MSINVFTISGQFTSTPPEHRYFESGTQTAKFAVRVYRGKNKQTQEHESDFFDCQTWGYAAEKLEKCFQAKGAVNITGRLKQERWEDKDGQKRSRVLLVCDRIDVPFAPDSYEAPPQAAPAMAPPVAQAAPAMTTTPVATQAAPAPAAVTAQQEDIPF